MPESCQASGQSSTRCRFGSEQSLDLVKKNWGSQGGHLFDHLLWSRFQSSLHKLQIKVFHMLDLCGQLSCTDSYVTSLSVLRHASDPVRANLPPVTYMRVNQSIYFPCLDLNLGPPSTKPICYQLSYPGLDDLVKFM